MPVAYPPPKASPIFLVFHFLQFPCITMNTNRRVKTGLGKLAPIFVEGQWTVHHLYLSSPHFNMHTYIHIHPPFHYPTLLYIIHVAHPCIFPSCHPLPPHTVQAPVPLTHTPIPLSNPSIPKITCIPLNPMHMSNYVFTSLVPGLQPSLQQLAIWKLEAAIICSLPCFCCLV